MDKAEQVRKLLKKMASEAGPDNTILAKVKSVNVGAMTCDLTDDDSGLDFFDVRLRPVLDGKESITVVPKVGTWALAVRIEGDEDWMVISVGEADKWRLKIGTTVLEQNEVGLLVQKGTDSLKEAMTLIIEAVNVIVMTSGTPPDYIKLGQAMLKVNNLLR